MATSVNSAFAHFLSDIVNLDPDVSRLARSSRDWLLGQIRALPDKIFGFPPLYSEMDLHYGSFARRTKIRELDDLDMIVCLAARGITYEDSWEKVTLYVPEGNAWRGYCHENTNMLNSRRVINLFVGHLKDVPQYRRSDIGRNGAAAVLNLASYTWSFDIVPGFFTAPELDGRTYYIIPDGQGNWMKTDPRIDQARVTNINQAKGGHVLNALRLLKFWNRRSTMPSMLPYLLECMVLNYYESGRDASQFVDLEVAPVLRYLSTAVFQPVYDPKKIQGDINGLSFEERLQISSRATLDASRAEAARNAESRDDHKESIRIWGEIFGSSFPKYG